jgi:hypothetical protein
MDRIFDLRDNFRACAAFLAGAVVIAALALGVHPAQQPYSPAYMPVPNVQAPARLPLDRKELDALMASLLPAAKPARPTVAQISLKRAAHFGIMPAVNWVCTAKQVPCEMLLALAQLESSTGILDTHKSSADGVWQITAPQFIARARKYGPANMELVAAYLKTLDPKSREARRTREAYRILAHAFAAMKSGRYGRDPHYALRVDEEILRARNGNLVIPAVLVASCMLDDLKIVADKTGLPLNETFQYAYLAHVYGGPAAAAVLEARGHADWPVAGILEKHYAYRYESRGRLTRAGHMEDHAYVREILRNNGVKYAVGVGDFIGHYVDIYGNLAQAIGRQMAEAPQVQEL